MSKIVSYKTYTIASWPLHRRENGRWKVEITITWECAGTMTLAPFSSVDTSSTEEEADIDGINYGQRIIDGRIAGLSLDDAA